MAPSKTETTETDPHTQAVADNLAIAQTANPGLIGIVKIEHELEVAFVHALHGAEAESEACLAKAKAEVEKFGANLSHLEAHIALLVAKVHAALAKV